MSTKLVLALDTIGLDLMESNDSLYQAINPLVDVYKISLPFIINGLLAAPEALDCFLSENEIFFDFKLHDIPHQMSESVVALSRYNPELITVHTVAGPRALRSLTSLSKLVGVTVLTSMDEDEWRKVNSKGMLTAISEFTDIAFDSGLDGVVCDNASVGMIKHRYPGMLTVVPGFRMDSDEGDQKRTVTPDTLDVNNVDYLVVGRTVTNLEDVDSIARKLETIRDFLGATA